MERSGSGMWFANRSICGFACLAQCCDHPKSVTEYCSIDGCLVDNHLSGISCDVAVTIKITHHERPPEMVPT